jgi:hypothetical protein
VGGAGTPAGFGNAAAGAVATAAGLFSPAFPESFSNDPGQGMPSLFDIHLQPSKLVGWQPCAAITRWQHGGRQQ